MPRIAFSCGSIGVAIANFSELYLAVAQSPHAYIVRGLGGGAAVIVGRADTISAGGVQIPDIDESDRRFPDNLAGKNVIFSVASGAAVGTPLIISITIRSRMRSSDGGEQVEYDWEGHVRVLSTFVGGFEVDGTAHRPRSLDAERFLYGSLMQMGPTEVNIREVDL